MNNISDKGGSVAVIGSLNIDYIATVPRLPKAGETLSALGLVQLFGGKGANQATAAARQGARTAMVGCVGQDGHGEAYATRLAREGIDCSGMGRTRRELTGTALIFVDENGENNIVVAAGANGELKPAHVRKHAGLIRKASVVLAQFEVPLPALLEGFAIAAKGSAAMMLNPSPLRKDFPWGRFELDTLIVNEGEAYALLGTDSRRYCQAMRRKRIQRLLVTRGAKSTLLFKGETIAEVPALRVKPVDTVGAGDAFAGAYAAWRALGADDLAAIRFANVAGALTTLEHGAQEAMPDRKTTIKRVEEMRAAAMERNGLTQRRKER